MNDLISRPGAVNAHTHLYSGLVPLGMPPPDPPPRSFPEILQRVWWRLDRALDEPALRAAARYHVAHALLAGTTTLIDHHESPHLIDGSLDVLAEACEDLGARAVLCYGATERNEGRDEARRGLAECRRFIEARTSWRPPSATDPPPSWRPPSTPAHRDLVRGAIGIHAAFTVSDATLHEAGDLARELKAPVHVHVSEDASDEKDARRRGHASVLSRLLDCEALPAGSILAHGVHMPEGDVYTCLRRGLWIVQNPRSNAANRVGYARALDGSARVALGTDGFPSDMDDEAAALRAAAAREGDPSADPALRMEAGRALAAQVFGVKAISSDQVRFDGPSGRVVEVDVGGRPAVREGRLVTADLAAIDADARAQATRLWDRMEKLS